jgi:hypothetical protein
MAVYVQLMKQGYDPNDKSTDIETPAGIGNVACAAVLEFRHHDKANQLGDLAAGSYSDWTGYISRNKPTAVPVRTPMADPNHWQPLIYVNSTGDLVTQPFLGAQWCYVNPFAMSKGDEFRGLAQTLPPATYGSVEYQQQADELIAMSAGLTDRQKMIAEYWLDGPKSEQPPGHWALFAQFVSARDHHSLDDDVKLFFALSNAIFDAGIAAIEEHILGSEEKPMRISQVRGLAAVAGLFLALSVLAQEKKIKRSDLPPALEKTVAAQSSGASTQGFSEERENGRTFTRLR